MTAKMDIYSDRPGSWDEDLEPEETAEPETGSAPAGVPRPRSTLLPGAFLSQVSAQVVVGLNESRGKPQSVSRGRLAKFWYGPPHGSVHYEIWLHERTMQIELGLHCESTPEYNRALYNAFDRCLLEIQAALGSSFWLEEWDHGWIRLYETHPFYPMDAARVEEIAARMCEIVGVLQPMLEDIVASLPSPPPATPERRRDFHHRRA